MQQPLPPILDVTLIEQAVERQLVEKIPSIKKTAVQKDGRFLFTNPAIAVSIYETGEWVQEGKSTYLVPLTLQLLLTVQSAKSEEDRRRIANPLLFAIAIALTRQKLGLKLKDPGIEPKKWSDVTDEKDWTENKIVYLFTFTLGIYFEVPKDEDAAVDMIGVAVDYLLEQGDLVAAQDEITVKE